MEAYVMVSRAAIAAASADFRLELSEILGLEGADPAASGMENEIPAGTNIANLDLASAKLFLAGCQAKTKRVLRLIIDRDGQFLLRDLERAANVRAGGLSGVWTGLTKRTRTITGKPVAKLIHWDEKKEGEWRGMMTKRTTDSLRAALDAERRA